MDSIIKPFGIAKLIFQDKDGGNVDTMHNVRSKDTRFNNGKGVYATERSRQNYENREDYDSDRYHNNQYYKQKNREASDAKKHGKLKDTYSDKDFKMNDKIDLDHTISAKEIHDDPGRVLAGLDGEDLANTESNLNATDRSVNRSKKAKSVDEFIKQLKTTRQSRQNKVEQLKTKKDLSDQERKELKKLAEQLLLTVKNKEMYLEYNKLVTQGSRITLP